MEYSQLPVGFAMALAMNQTALEKFGAMPKAQKQMLVDKAHNVHLKREMHELVEEIGRGGI